MSGVSNTGDIDEDHHHAENDRYHESGGVVSMIRSADYPASVYSPYDDDDSCGGCAGCCTCRVDVLLDTGSNEPLGIINYAIL
ncbi:hypothetical protein ALC62_14986 [Cyphomyrmex costatus]|uniref:Uncharacterized protein n=1 Tax=Cyphomyrmex costatus TaxID=456900 RepID=A0A195C2Y1_9HYME|nr:hypothetical protein ALC62_14986 [Cyphomyrmex costatus]